MSGAGHRAAGWLAALAGVVLLAPSAWAGGYAAAYLENGLGVRAAGMGDAFVAVVDDASAAHWNPAGLTRARSRDALASVQTLSLGRRQSSLAFSLNLRHELAIGAAWLHAGVDDVVGRTPAGVATGEIGDAEDAFYVAAARAVGPRLSLGLTMAVLRQNLEVPGISESRSSGHGFDLGAMHAAGPRTTLAVVVRHLGSRLNWKVARSAQQSSNTSDGLPVTLVMGAAHRPVAGLVLAADLEHSDLERHLGLGGEWQVGQLLTVRAGLARVLAEDSRLGVAACGASLRPMRRELLELHFAYTGDQVGAGGRSLAALGFRF